MRMQTRYCHRALIQVTKWSTNKWLNYAVSNNLDDSTEPDAIGSGRAETPSESIICVDCGGNAHLLTTSARRRSMANWRSSCVSL